MLDSRHVLHASCDGHPLIAGTRRRQPCTNWERVEGASFEACARDLRGQGWVIKRAGGTAYCPTCATKRNRGKDPSP